MLSFGLWDIGVLFWVVWGINYIMWKGWLSSHRLPPSYYGFPIIGVIPFIFLYKNQLDAMQELHDKNGPVIRLKLGWTTVVVVSGTKAVKEVLTNDDLLGRPTLKLFDVIKRIVKAELFVSSEGNRWKELRNFSVSTLRDLGFGKTPLMEGHIQDELEDYLSKLEQSSSQPYNFRTDLLPSVSNNIATLIFGERLPYDHPKRKKLNNFFMTFSKGTSVLLALSFVPYVLDFLMYLRMRMFNNLHAAAVIAKEVFDEETSSHLNNLDVDDKRDFMDHLLAKQNTNAIYTPEVVRGTCLSFFGAGTNTTRMAVEYLLHLAAAYPDLQEEMYQEISREVGDSRLPSWSDQEKLPLLKAFIAERHRIFTIAPIGIFRKASRDTTICGMHIPQGTILTYNLHSVHYDADVFKNPSEFNPKRFIDGNGKFINHENVIPFAIGRRACAGETFAVFEVFLYFASVLQRFQILPDEPVLLVRPSKIFVEPTEQKLRFIPRT